MSDTEVNFVVNQQKAVGWIRDQPLGETYFENGVIFFQVIATLKCDFNNRPKKHW